ncbi:TonB-dependent receptor [Fluviicola chungangensis]|uniref:TonB-dependent receptor n=1 Tax=Fluviicola chungangensis TaxID=2597671 RepID=A0A556N766_9FLAO|nr:TonB-dependent receptor [Fluviicola chungangensis]TSJ48032.1 TonB-dependent receptor [Fluviicola chungangensis]
MKTRLLICLLVSFQSFSQEKAWIKGRIFNPENESVADAVLFIYSADSTLLSMAVSEEDGHFEADVIPVDTVFIRVTHENFTEFTTPAIPFSAASELNLAFRNKTRQVEEVTVSASKPMIERKPGMMVLNVEQSLSATGSSAFEILEKSPGVSASSTDNISLNGKSGIIVQIDGKAQPMSGTDLANYLRGIPSSAIDKIELISNPSAKYDAAGSAIINIRLKKDTRLGTNGTATVNYGQGVYPKAGAGISLNHRNKKVNIFGSYNYAYRKGFNHLILERRFYQQDTFVGAYIQDNDLKFPVSNHSARFGMDFQLNMKNALSFVVNGMSNAYTIDGINKSDVQMQQDVNSSRFETTNDRKEKWFNGSANVNYKHVLDSSGSEVTADLDYAAYQNENNQRFHTGYYDLNGTPIQNAYILTGDLNGKLAIHAAKVDLHKVLNVKNFLDAGVKSSYVIADNDLEFYDRSTGTPVYDTTKSNHYIYRETIGAGYLTWNYEGKKWSFQLGARGEYTHVKGIQRTTDAVSDTGYFQLFPTAYLGFNLSEKQHFELTMNRRIDRPSYDQLNPFKFYLDPSTYREGNPHLRPQTTYTFELGYSFKNVLFVNAGIATTKDNITEVIAPLTQNQNVTVQTNINLSRADLVYANISAPVQVTKWWNSVNNINAYVALYSGNVAQTNLKNRGSGVLILGTVNTFTLKKDWSIEWNASYHTPEIYAFDHIKEIWHTGIGVQKKILQSRGVIKFAWTDIFYTNYIRANVSFTNYKEYFDVKRDTRVATLSFTYKFGKASVAGSRRRGTGADDLKGRVNTGGG